MYVLIWWSEFDRVPFVQELSLIAKALARRIRGLAARTYAHRDYLFVPCRAPVSSRTYHSLSLTGLSATRTQNAPAAHSPHTDLLYTW